MSDKLLYEKADNIVTLTLNDPDVRNAISDEETISGIVDALTKINDDYDVRCAILTGAGTAFSSGGNVKKMQRHDGMFAGGVGAGWLVKYAGPGAVYVVAAALAGLWLVVGATMAPPPTAAQSNYSMGRT